MPSWVSFVVSTLVGGIVCIVFLVWLIKRNLSRLLGALTGLAGGGTTSPVRIKAQPRRPDQPWRNPAAVEKARAFFESKQFEWVADLDLTPMKDVYAAILVDRDGYGAVVYEHPLVGVWVDIVAHYAGRGGMTVSSVPTGGTLDSPPFSHKHYLKGGRPEQLWTMFQEKVRMVPSSERLRLTAENVVAAFERAYADEMDWRNAQGGASADEVRRVDANRIIPEKRPLADDRQVETAVRMLRLQANADLLEGLRDRFREQTGAEEVDETLTFVHDNLSESALAELITEHVGDDSLKVTGLPQSCRDLAPLEAFARLQTLLPESGRFEKIGELDFPLLTHVYAAPQGPVPVDIFPHRRLSDEDDDS